MARSDGNNKSEIESTLTEPIEATAAQTRTFLEHDAVQRTSRHEKKEFLKTKGIPEKEIERLLDEGAARPSETRSSPGPVQAAQSAAAQDDEQPSPSPSQPQSPIPMQERPPIIITYPEFLTKPVNPPPLVTAKGVLDTLSVFSWLSVLLYGTSKYVLEPMVDALTQARLSLHETAKADVGKLVNQLEGTVSKVPFFPRQCDNDSDDGDSTYSDPNELFHRDIGVQTSRPPSPCAFPASLSQLAHHVAAIDTKTVAGAKSEAQARRVAALVADLRILRDDLVAQTEDYGEVRGQLGVLEDELDKLTYPASTTYNGVYNGLISSLSSSSSGEPDDEIRKAKENIRRLKGVMLGARRFPGAPP